MLFQMHAKVNEITPMSDSIDAMATVTEEVALGRQFGSALSGTVTRGGHLVGFWSVTDADEDPRIARVRQIAENLRCDTLQELGGPDIAVALLKAIDGNPQEVTSDAAG